MDQKGPFGEYIPTYFTSPPEFWLKMIKFKLELFGVEEERSGQEGAERNLGIDGYVII